MRRLVTFGEMVLVMDCVNDDNHCHNTGFDIHMSVFAYEEVGNLWGDGFGNGLCD